MNKKYAGIYTNYLRTILSNYSILGLSFLIFVVLGTVLTAVYYFIAFFIAFIIIVCTFGLIFLKSPETISSLFKAGDNMTLILEICSKAFPYVFGITLASSVTVLILLCTNKEKRSTSRIVFASIITGLTLIFGLIYLFGGLK